MSEAAGLATGGSAEGSRPRGWTGFAASPPARIGFELALWALGAFACLFFSGYLFVDVTVPAGVEGDHLFLVTMAKSYIDGHGFRLNPNLGFPDVQDFLYFPTFETTQRAILWLGAVVTRDPFSAVHAYYVAGIALMFGASQWALRWLGVRWPLAAAASVAYVVSPYFVIRAFGHDFLALYYAAPFGLALALKVGTQPPPPNLRAFLLDPFVITTVLVAGASGIYYGFFSLMFLAFAAVAAAAAQRRLGPLVTGLALGVPLFVVLLISGFGLDLPAALFGAHPKAGRQAYEELVYGLDLASMGGVLDVTATARARYAEALAAAPQAFSNEGGGEFPGLALTFALVLSPLVAACAPVMAAHDDPRPLADHTRRRLNLIGFAALCATFGLIYSARGGLGFLFGLLVIPEIRATGRIVPFLAFLALVIVCMAAELTAGSRRTALRWGPAALAALALGLSMLPAYKALQKSQMSRYDSPAQREKRTSTPEMLVAKDRLGALRVLELPVMFWPEAPVTRADIDPYAAQLPYIYDRRHSATRWSYGASALQPGFMLRQFNLKRTDGLPAIARAYGYDSVLLLKKNFDIGQAAVVQEAMDRQLGVRCRVYDDAVYALYSLKPPCGGAR